MISALSMDSENGGDPPDTSNGDTTTAPLSTNGDVMVVSASAMDNGTVAPASNVTMTPICDGGMRISFDAPIHHESESSSQSNRKRSRIIAGITDSPLGTKSSFNETMKAQVDDNIVPRIDFITGNCIECDEKVAPGDQIRCYDCRRYFHGSCKAIAHEKVGGESIMPAPTYIKNWNNHLMKHNNGEYIGGRFFWVCSSCIMLKEVASPRNALDRQSLLESVVLKNNMQHAAAFNQIAESLSALNSTLDKLHGDNGPPPSSDGIIPAGALQNKTLRPKVSNFSGTPIAYNTVTKTSLPVNKACDSKHHGSLNSQTSNVLLSPSNPPHFNAPTSTPDAGNFKYRLKLFSLNAEVHIMDILKKLDNEGKLNSYDNYRSRGKLAIDLLFKDSIKATEAHTKLSNFFVSCKDHKVEVHTPEMIISKRTFLVGMSEGHTPESIRSKVSKRYPELDLSGENKWNFKVLEPKQCIKNKSI